MGRNNSDECEGDYPTCRRTRPVFLLRLTVAVHGNVAIRNTTLATNFEGLLQ